MVSIRQRKKLEAKKIPEEKNKNSEKTLIQIINWNNEHGTTVIHSTNYGKTFFYGHSTIHKAMSKDEIRAEKSIKTLKQLTKENYIDNKENELREYQFNGHTIKKYSIDNKKTFPYQITILNNEIIQEPIIKTKIYKGKDEGINLFRLYNRLAKPNSKYNQHAHWANIKLQKKPEEYLKFKQQSSRIRNFIKPLKIARNPKSPNSYTVDENEEIIYKNKKTTLKTLIRNLDNPNKKIKPKIQRKEWTTHKNKEQNITTLYSIDNGDSYIYGLTKLNKYQDNKIEVIENIINYFDKLKEETKNTTTKYEEDNFAYLNWITNIIISKETKQEVKELQKQERIKKQLKKIISPLKIDFIKTTEGKIPGMKTVELKYKGKGRERIIHKMLDEINITSPWTYQSLIEAFKPGLNNTNKKTPKKIISKEKIPEFALIEEKGIFYYGKISASMNYKNKKKLFFEEILAFSYYGNLSKDKTTIFQNLIFEKNHYTYRTKKDYNLEIKTNTKIWTDNAEILNQMITKQFNPQLTQLHTQNAYEHIQKLIQHIDARRYNQTYAARKQYKKPVLTKDKERHLKNRTMNKPQLSHEENFWEKLEQRIN